MHRRDPDRSPFDEALRIALAVGVALVLLIPHARGMHAGVGWLPLWLVGMPAASWWLLRRGHRRADTRRDARVARCVVRRPVAVRRLVAPARMARRAAA